MTVALVLVQKDGLQKEIPVSKPVQIIGRQTDCQIRIPSASVSRHHCEVLLRDGTASVRDLGSSNGTYVNGRKVPQTELAAGDVVTVGDLIFVVRVDGKPDQIDIDDVLEVGTVLHGDSSTAHSKAPTRIQPHPNAPTRAAGTGAPASKPAGSAASKPAGKPGDDLDDSSVSDFDFLDEDDDIKKQPKL